MAKLLRSNFARMRRNKLLWGCMACALLVGIFLTRSAQQNALYHRRTPSMDALFFSFQHMIVFVAAVITTLFIGVEYSDGTIRNKLCTGAKRGNVYLANLLTCTVANLLIYAAYLVGLVAVGLILRMEMSLTWSALFQHFGIGFLLIISYTAIFTLASMLVPNKTIVAIVLLLGIIVGLLGAAHLIDKMNAPPYYTQLAIGDDGAQHLEEVANPRLPTPEEKARLQVMAELLPFGQTHLLADMTGTHPWRMMLFSGMIILLCTGGGIIAFRRKDLK